MYLGRSVRVPLALNPKPQVLDPNPFLGRERVTVKVHRASSSQFMSLGYVGSPKGGPYRPYGCLGTPSGFYIWGFPKIRGTFLGVPIIGTIVFGV